MGIVRTRSNTAQSSIWLTLTLLLTAGITAGQTTINVMPGSNTLQAALDGAADGDILLLASGSYTGQTFVSKSATIRAASAAADPVLTDRLVINAAGATVVLQGLEFRTHLNYTSSIAAPDTLIVLESTFTDASMFAAGARPRELIAIGNHFSSAIGFHSNNSPDQSEIEIRASELAYFAGNVVTVPPGNRLEVEIPSDVTRTFVIGNSFAGGIYRNFNLIRFEGSETNVIGNRFEARLDIDAQDMVAYLPKIMTVRGLGRHSVLNNLFRLTDTSAAAGTSDLVGLTAINVNNDAAGIEIRNNVIDYGSLTFDAPTLGSEGTIRLDVAGLVTGNIIVNTTRPNVSIAAAAMTDSLFANNLCFNTGETCGSSDGNMDGDPLFVDTVDYQPGGGSPAIDSGPMDAFLVDLDGTRADMGIYGGSFPMDQYDLQREAVTTAPWAYPLFEASRSVNQIGDLLINVIGAARLR